MVVKWTFYDGVTLDEYTFDINPNDGGTPNYNKTITYENTAGPGGVTLMFEGRDEPPKLRFSGTILEQDQFDTFKTWFDKRHQIRVTDDLSRQYWIYITKFEARRRRAYSHPWKHDYEIEATILSWE